ncbi:MAG: hypothetical protein FWG63_00295 [Defluviitaleaceae bacterium]|nr:hypothetical protein [Defluviitaleaceae bacterium]
MRYNEVWTNILSLSNYIAPSAITIIMSIPGMDGSIIKGMNTPISECVPMEEVFPDV